MPSISSAGRAVRGARSEKLSPAERSGLNQALAKAFAFRDAGKMQEAREWAAELVAKNYGSMRMFAYRDVTPREVLNRRNLLHCSDLERDFLPRNTGLRKIDRVSKMDRIP
jgi:hypothetical protein